MTLVTKLFIYNITLGVISGVIFGSKTNETFLKGNYEQISFDVGGVIGGIMFPIALALLPSTLMYIFFLAKKEKARFVQLWMKNCAALVTMQMILFIQI